MSLTWDIPTNPYFDASAADPLTEQANHRLTKLTLTTSIVIDVEVASPLIRLNFDLNHSPL